ncbi:restriction endonuclease subunit S [Staphylococcus pasteuri]|uniref:restriction endonuclease subunit S n=1 Tax=Staphylococcus pasteuri TaxID=45972 RepID=UPI002DB9F626|nr:restriction endonuclease subunit S [Staphylococcus pasteuri]MEB6612565.1 restriction endonuclease subunit S [Staphylococcus pasteuri]
MSEQINTPKLRFPEFRDEWESKEFKDIIKINSGKDYKHLNIGKYPVYGTGGYMLSVSDYLYKNDAIGIGRKGTINKPYLLKGPFWTVDTLFYCTPLANNDLSFLLNLFRKVNWKKYDESTGVPSLSKVTISKIKCKVPTISEQEKIGTFFSKLDRQIELEEEKLELLEQQKRGYMQQIFSQKLRFKDENGNDYPDWEETTLKNITNYISSKKSSNQYNENNNSEGYPVYDAIQEIGKDLQYDMKEPYISILKDGAGVGRLNLRAGKSSVIGTMGYIQANNVDIQFLYYRMKLLNFRKFIIGSTIPHLYYKDYSKEKILIPTSNDEQKKIGHFILNIDKLIDNKTLKLDYLKQRKQGLLQRMFI